MSTPQQIRFRGATYRLISAQEEHSEYEALKAEMLMTLDVVFSQLSTVASVLTTFGKHLQNDDPKFNDIMGAHNPKEQKVALKAYQATSKMLDLDEMSDRARKIMPGAPHPGY